MKRTSAACCLVFTACYFCHGAIAQGFATGGTAYSNDSDGFRIKNHSIGVGYYTSDESFYDRIGYQRSFADFAAPGFNMHGISNSVLGAKSFASPVGQLKGEANLTNLTLQTWETATTGSMQISGQAVQVVNYEIRFEKNIVDSVNSLTNRVTFFAQTLAVDYQTTPRLNFAVVLGHLNYSDQNVRSLWKTKVSYVLSEEYGLRTYLKFARHANSRPYTGNYFSPDSLRDYQGGLGFRRRLSMLRGVLSGYAETGSQTADSVSTPIHGEQLRLEAFPNRPWHYDFSTGVQTSAGTGGGTNYKYRYINASLVWPF